MREHEIEVYQALQAYVYAQPKHTGGLCYWLTSLSDPCASTYDPDAPKIDGYVFIERAIRNIPAIRRQLKPGQWIRDENGPTPKRLILAKDLMLALENRQLIYRDGKWQGSGESPE